MPSNLIVGSSLFYCNEIVHGDKKLCKRINEIYFKIFGILKCFLAFTNWQILFFRKQHHSFNDMNKKLSDASWDLHM
jgi:hypothetical protein